MKAHLFARIFLSGLLLVTGVAHADEAGTEQQLHVLMARSGKISSASTTQRVGAFANLFSQQKTPYLVDPLGEGASGTVSQGPLYRFDGFDCTTFVETVLALALSSNENQFRQRMNQIRYKDAVVAYQTRNHFPSVDWIPNNIKNGFVKDITGSVAGAKTKWSQTWIEKGEWFKRKGPDFAEMGEDMQPVLGQLPYVAKEDLTSSSELLARIPSGTIFHVMRPNWDLRRAIGTHLDISHMGFLVREKGVLYMVHASNGASRDGSDDSMRVKKEVLSDYVERVMMASPTMAGMNLLAPL